MVYVLIFYATDDDRYLWMIKFVNYRFFPKEQLYAVEEGFYFVNLFFFIMSQTDSGFFFYILPDFSFFLT